MYTDPERQSYDPTCVSEDHQRGNLTTHQVLVGQSAQTQIIAIKVMTIAMV